MPCRKRLDRACALAIGGLLAGGLLSGPVLLAQNPPPAPAQADGPVEPDTQDDEDLVTLHGCIIGSSLKSTRPDPGTVTGSLTSSDVYRLQGSREIRRQIKKASRALVKVTGRIDPGPDAMVWGKKIGGVKVGIGTARGVIRPTDQRPDATPVVEVKTIEILKKTCD